MYDLNKDGSDDPVLDYRIKSWQRKFSNLQVIAPKRQGYIVSVDAFDKSVAEYETTGHFYHWRVNRREDYRVSFDRENWANVLHCWRACHLGTNRLIHLFHGFCVRMWFPQGHPCCVLLP